MSSGSGSAGSVESFIWNGLSVSSFFASLLEAKPDWILLDNMSIADLKACVAMNQGACLLEASGGITSENLLSYAETGVDYISIGALTKDCQSIDLSMRFSM